MIFNDHKIKTEFEKTMWVCVSQEAIGTNLLKDIILQAGGTPGEAVTKEMLEAMSKEMLEKRLRDRLKDIKFFLVLDDVWDAKIWDIWLRMPLQDGAVGSRVLITTRKEVVAKQMKAIHIHKVDQLSLKDSWLLLCKKVTQNENEEREVESLKDIGMRIVEKCHGLPLAITTIGGVLCGKLNKWEWERVECNSAWSREGLPEGVHQALYLSYEDLPSHLKQCFLHCSLFPEDSWLEREDLVQLWVAEGFVVEVEGEEYPSLEEIAQGYLDELIQRSLLQVLDGEDSKIYGFTSCTMHDLLRLMCHFLATGENLVITDISKRLPADDDTRKLRRLSIVASKSQDIKPILHVTQKHKSLRTLMLYHNAEMLDDKDVEDCLKNFRRLRVARLCYTNIQSLPYSAGNLLHLRYLNLYGCEKLESLPESIASLQKLQFLILEFCYKLHTLPKGVVQLRNLRTLNVDHMSLKELPSGIARLEHLNVLKGATVSLFSSHNSNNSSSSSSSSCSLEEICQLRKLRELSIYLRISARSNPNVNGLNISLTALKYLMVLKLDYSDNYSNDDINDSIFDVTLHPPSCVCQIQIYNFLGHQFPQWLMSSSISLLLPNLKELVIRNCYNCLLLPPLGKLPNLEVLNIYSLPAVTNIGSEFFGYEEASTSDGLAHESGGSKSASSSPVLFPRLKELSLLGLINLEAWDWVPEVGGTVAMPQLNELKVNSCPKLSSLPEGLTHQATRLTSLCVTYTNINSFSGFPALKTLNVEVHDVGKLSLPNWLVHNRPHWTSLQKLILWYTNQSLLFNFLQDDPGWPLIREIPVVEIKDGRGNYIKYSSTIEKNTRDLVNLLMRKDEDATTHVVVLAIVGLGGIGKTTLAQMIFNDNKIKAVFEKTMWVCVSQEAIGTDLLKDIILQAEGTPGEARTKALLEKILVNLLKDIKFFLVLDDVWDPEIWDGWLRKPLQVGAVGSKVLITTRNRGVADRMKADHIHRVDALSPDDSWLLMRKKVTKKVEEEREIESLKDIGMRIVEKCQGLPLAISVIGGVLCGEFRRWKWERVECNSAWSQKGLPEGVHQALYLSYEDLPSHLKQCFLHCSLFREDTPLFREDLVQLWVAEGFVVEVEGEEYPSLEEIAQGYLDELIQRSLLQVLDGEDSIIYGFTSCRMHDLLRLMCHFLARGENLVITDISKRLPSTADDDSRKLRRLSIVAPEFQDIKPILHVTQKHKSLRTLMLCLKAEMLDDKDVEDCLKNFRRLRVARLCYTNIQSLPYSAGNLLQLRYLNLYGCRELKSLPESIASLQNLQFLILEGCNTLHTLPKGVVQLCNLRTLNVDYTSVKEFPSGIARLEHLNVLKGVTVSLFSSHNSNNSSGSSSSCSLEEICQLRKLRELSINLRISARSNPNVNGLNISLTALKYLLVLHLDYLNSDINDSIFDVALHPPSCVRLIAISRFPGDQFPQWLMSSSISSLLPNLKELVIRGCYNCLLLPPLGKLPNLEVLNIYSLPAVTNIGSEFFGYEEASTSDGLAHQTGGSKHASSSPVLFPRLKELSLYRLINLEAWDWVPEVGGTVAMPQLNELIVNSCPKLSSLPEGLTRQATRVTSLYVTDTNINSFSGFPALEILGVEVHDVGNLSLPNWLVNNRPHYWTSLEMLKLKYTNQSLRSNFLQDDPGWPAIREIPVVEIKDRRGNYIKHSSTFPTTFHTKFT